MSSNDAVDQAITALSSAKANISCGDMARTLESLGFTIHEKRAGHKIYTHKGIDGFYSANYDCGHGKNPKLKPCYVVNVIRVLRKYKADIAKHLGEDK